MAKHKKIFKDTEELLAIAHKQLSSAGDNLFHSGPLGRECSHESVQEIKELNQTQEVEDIWFAVRELEKRLGSVLGIIRRARQAKAAKAEKESHAG